MRTEVIKVDTIDAAVKRILDELKNTRSRENAIYFDGWDGLGASAVLRAVAQRLAPNEQTRPPGLEFEQVIHIDSSKWESRRAVQREISEQLKLPGWVRKMFDKQDDDDDFSGIAEGSRTEIAEVTAEIHRSMQSRRFLLVLHNGSSENFWVVGSSKEPGAAAAANKCYQPHGSTLVDLKYKDAFEKTGLAHSYDDCGNGPTPSAVMMMWDCPKIEIPITYQTCMIEMMVDEQCSELTEDAQITINSGLSSLHFPDPIYSYVTSLHVYDSSTITNIYAPEWTFGTMPRLRWCRVERCPKIHTVFHTPKRKRVSGQRISGSQFEWLRTFWASQLLTARHIWCRPSTKSYSDEKSFDNLKLLHLDFCPSLIHVLPIQVFEMQILHQLETIEIICCGDLREIFPLYSRYENQEEKTIVFPMLKHIHLWELPKLERICCGLSVAAPMLETVKIRGCWSLKRLPAVGDDSKHPKVDCEKDWWDGLEWDGLEAKHHPSLYEPVHSAYYKNQLPRVSLLR
ncbi:hypothetical protein ZWY2020_011649 [Hordeum vulgare]|nr:hypothetical protein ZWY2020_011649 [Hordeum vulgare]